MLSSSMICCELKGVGDWRLRRYDVRKMKLLDVETVLGKTTGYAVLAHWGVEVTYKEMIALMKMEEQERNEVEKRYDYQKIASRAASILVDAEIYQMTLGAKPSKDRVKNIHSAPASS
ncbi:hypothetical protein PISMIDRAFT_682742 [Pisolithus microcarpus 441]|uniref:Uncharacterized protein n=1 Tax=Pisolithus microcarpus 441 TaxID=765257 RepID=A0A0C9ZJ66_9AGAM|nr:hypothetical protein PISMIDRAFT_682742 [Pisolithus microcarpus 441]